MSLDLQHFRVQTDATSMSMYSRANTTLLYVASFACHFSVTISILTSTHTSDLILLFRTQSLGVVGTNVFLRC